MRNKSLSFLSFLALAGLLAALTAGPAYARSNTVGSDATNTGTQTTWWYPVWPRASAAGATTTQTAPASAAALAPTSSAAAPQAGVTSQEQQFFDLLNQDRTQNGQKPLTLNPDLSRLAREKAQDMVANNYFDHHSPALGWPTDMVRKAGIAYRYGVGENIVESATVERLNLQLMSSPTHKANILDPGYTDVGVGVVPDGHGGLMAVQEFIGR